MSIHRTAALAIAATALVAACGGDDDTTEDTTEDTADDTTEEAPDGDVPADDSADGDDDASLVEPGFGGFVSGTLTLTGAEEATYSVDDPAYGFVGAGGCGGGQFGISVQVVDTATGFTVANLSAEVDESLDGGGTGSFPVDDVTLLTVTDGDLSASRTYDGPGTLEVTSHDTGGPDFVLNERRMALTIDGSLEGSDGEVAVAADLLWVMGCP